MGPRRCQEPRAAFATASGNVLVPPWPITRAVHFAPVLARNRPAAELPIGNFPRAYRWRGAGGNEDAARVIAAAWLPATYLLTYPQSYPEIQQPRPKQVPGLSPDKNKGAAGGSRVHVQ